MATLAVKGNGGTAALALYDGSGNLLTIGNAAPGVDAVISDFVAQSGGTYYVEVSGATGLAYDLVATEGADFDIHGNSLAAAQPLNGASAVLGAIVPATSPLFVLDDQIYGAFNPIYPTDPLTGAFTGPAIAAPGSPLNNPFGLNMAYDGTYIYYNDGPRFRQQRDLRAQQQQRVRSSTRSCRKRPTICGVSPISTAISGRPTRSIFMSSTPPTVQ